ncbi:MAG: RluA family pseudouridine synthase [Phycisphaerales bacterium]
MPQFSVEPNPSVTFSVLHEDDDLLVVNKPPRLPTQPGKGHERDTLLNGLFATHAAKLQNLGASRDFGLLHRLDKDASGLLLIALRNRAYDALRSAFQKREMRKFYWALCSRAPKEPMGVIRLPIAETGGTRSTPKTAKISRAGKPAVTAYRVVDATAHGSLIEARAATGRLHQVRVHLEAIGCPILGDEFYASPAVRDAAPRLALHAHRLAFKHPVTGEMMDFRTPWPSDLRRALHRLGLKRPDLPRAASAPDQSNDTGKPSEV